MLRTATVLSLLVLAGCSTTAVSGASALSGQDLDAAYALYGPWEDQVTLEGRRYYIWRRRRIDDAGVERYCELRVEMGFRRMIQNSVMQGYPAACELFTVRYEVLTR